jgi:hypothetical protein
MNRPHAAAGGGMACFSSGRQRIRNVLFIFFDPVLWEMNRMPGGYMNELKNIALPQYFRSFFVSMNSR